LSTLIKGSEFNREKKSKDEDEEREELDNCEGDKSNLTFLISVSLDSLSDKFSEKNDEKEFAL
jgi:hypothetical protein